MKMLRIYTTKELTPTNNNPRFLHVKKRKKWNKNCIKEHLLCHCVVDINLFFLFAFAFVWSVSFYEIKIWEDIRDLISPKCEKETLLFFFCKSLIVERRFSGRDDWGHWTNFKQIRLNSQPPLSYCRRQLHNQNHFNVLYTNWSIKEYPSNASTQNQKSFFHSGIKINTNSLSKIFKRLVSTYQNRKLTEKLTPLAPSSSLFPSSLLTLSSQSCLALS